MLQKDTTNEKTPKKLWGDKELRASDSPATRDFKLFLQKNPDYGKMFENWNDPRSKAPSSLGSKQSFGDIDMESF